MCEISKMMGLVSVRRWEKRKRSNVHWRVVKVCVGSIQYEGIETFCPLGTNFDLRVLKHFEPKFINNLNYVKSSWIIFMLNWFRYFD